MSANNTISIRLEVTGDAASISKITNVLNGFKGLKGGIEDARSSMQKQWSTGGLTGLGAAIGSAETQVKTLKTRLTEIGGTLASNASAFGVATASVWGVYNAYDSLVKVEIRAETAMNRVSTMTTTLATLENRLTEARIKGNLSAADMAILEDRITDTKAKLATAQERSADLQGDVNEAWGAFASQVGPQVVAAGGSIVQLITNLRGSFAGFIPNIKNLISNFSVFATTSRNTMASGVSPLANMLPQIGTGAEKAATGVRVLSTAMKGLLIGTGVGIAITAIALLAEHFLNAAEASTVFKDATAKSEQAMESFTTVTSEVESVLTEFTKTFGDEFQKQLDIANRFIDSALFAKIAEEILTQKEAVETLTDSNKTLKEESQGLADVFGGLGILWGQLTGKFTENSEKVDENSEKITTHTKNVQNLEQQEMRLNAALALSRGGLSDNVTFLLRAVVAGKTLAEANVMLQNILKANNGTLDVNTQKVKTWADLVEEGNDAAVNWIRTAAAKNTADEAEKNRLIAMAQALGITIDLQDKSIKQIQELILVKLGLKDATEEDIKANEEWIKSMNDAQAKADELEEEMKLMQVPLDEINLLFGTNHDLMNTNVDIIDKLHNATVGVTNAYIDEEFALLAIASAHGLASAEIQEMTKNYVDNTTQIKEILAANIDYARALTDTNLKAGLVAQGHLNAATSVDEFLQKLVTSNAETERTNVLLTEVAAEVFNAKLPAGIANTNENLLLFIEYLSGSESAAAKWGDLVAEQFTQVNNTWMDLINSINQDSLKKAWKNLDLSAVPDAFKKAAKEAAKHIADLFDTEGKKKGLFAELETSLALFFATPGAQSKKGARKWMNKIIEEMTDELGKSEEIDALFKPIVDWLNSIPEEDRIAALTALSMVLPEIKTAAGDVIPNATQVNEIIAKLNEVAGLASGSIDGLATSASNATDKFGPLYDAILGNTKAENKVVGFDDKGNQILEPIDKGKGDTSQLIQDQKDLQAELQKTQEAFANLANEGSNSISILVKNSKPHVTTLNTYFGKTVPVALFRSQEYFANLANEGSNSLSMLISSAKAHVTTLNTYFTKTVPVALFRSQTYLANLANEGSRSLTLLARSSSTNMNGFVNNLKKGEQAVKNLQSAINNLKDKTVHIGLTGPGVKFLAQGFHGIVDKPTLMVVGEAGPEKVDVSPVVGAKATGLQFENQRNVRIEPVGKLDTGPRFERETIHDRSGPSTIQLITYTYLYPGSNEYRKSIQQVSLDNTGMFPTA